MGSHGYMTETDQNNQEQTKVVIHNLSTLDDNTVLSDLTISLVSMTKIITDGSDKSGEVRR